MIIILDYFFLEITKNLTINLNIQFLINPLKILTDV